MRYRQFYIVCLLEKLIFTLSHYIQEKFFRLTSMHHHKTKKYLLLLALLFLLLKSTFFFLFFEIFLFTLLEMRKVEQTRT